MAPGRMLRRRLSTSPSHLALKRGSPIRAASAFLRIVRASIAPTWSLQRHLGRAADNLVMRKTGRNRPCDPALQNHGVLLSALIVAFPDLVGNRFAAIRGYSVFLGVATRWFSSLG